MGGGLCWGLGIHGIGARSSQGIPEKQAALMANSMDLRYYFLCSHVPIGVAVTTDF